eukprot:TRINITY_DN40672_c0_g1_i1.p1 TRINITY_DN40672_c0_g1~~TRINITY_DN40672_c0_g1_i1.p1  ORF type:complete len:173 (+),score=24.73 TRINITY_DN40672_c0_g1_i1:155-673(+)
MAFVGASTNAFTVHSQVNSISGVFQSVSIPFAKHQYAAKTKPCKVLTVTAAVKTRRENRIARHERLRKKVEGTPERPRLAVFKSNKHIYCQVIDDSKMHTLASASTIQKPLAEELSLASGPTIEAARKVGETIAKACLEKGIRKVAFDRGGFLYHGQIRALADAAREHGLDF